MIETLQRTPLFEEHVSLGGKLVPFAGWEMPVQYPTGITAEHRAVRSTAGLFDVSHMGEFVVRGRQALDLLQRVSVNDVAALEVGQAQYSAMCYESGGIVDDLLVYRYADRYMVVVNASNLAKDWAWLTSHAGDLDVDVEDVSAATALIALQGPAAREVLGPLADADVDTMRYYRFVEGSVDGIPATIAGTGYTGEDGFELYVPAADAIGVWRALMEAGRSRGLVPAGLGARDSLRLEMGYALYGNELDAEHTPLEAGLGWITKLDAQSKKGDFIGGAALRRQKADGLPSRLVGLLLGERAFPRHGYDVLAGGERVGVVTSGTLSPSLGRGIALAYVPPGHAKLGAALQVDARGRALDAVVTRPPFYTAGSIRR
jgi:aminomethyltransferase